MTDLNARIATWMQRDPDPESRAELQSLIDANDTAELTRRFGGRLAFGTAGLRGVVGAGPARMNRLVILETSAGLGQYLLDTVDGAAQKGIVVGYDGRLTSEQFARDTAAVFAALGIRVYLSDRPVPTPVCAFAVGQYDAAAGVVVTASHNPPEYNGYKVYWGNGAQIIPPHDGGIAASIGVAANNPLPAFDYDAAVAADTIEFFDAELHATYWQQVRTLSVHADAGNRASYPIAYTAMHGVGADFVEEALKQSGFERVVAVPEQRDPDGNFPTVKFPNPEEPGAMDLVLALAEAHDAALALANDPDADRLAVAARDAEGEYHMLSGNQIGFLLGADRIKAASGKTSVGTSIVSSQLLGEMARAAGVEYFDTLTGFKWIANVALQRQAADPTETFAFGYEEALGYTVGELVRDKDGVSAAVAFAEMAAALAADGKTVFDALEDIYRTHGLFVTEQKSIWLDEASMAGPSLTDRLRVAAPDHVGGRNVVWRADLREGKAVAADGTVETLGLPPSDVLIYRLEGGARIIVRPSGTEPKVKSYYEVKSTVAADEAFEAAEERARAELTALVTTHQEELAALGENT